jgi:hypothetical protein
MAAAERVEEVGAVMAAVTAAAGYSHRPAPVAVGAAVAETVVAVQAAAGWAEAGWAVRSGQWQEL